MFLLINNAPKLLTRSIGHIRLNMKGQLSSFQHLFYFKKFNILPLRYFGTFIYTTLHPAHATLEPMIFKILVRSFKIQMFIFQSDVFSALLECYVHCDCKLNLHAFF